jgi:hypothetical protein
LVSIPDALPRFVSFPIVAVVEQIDAPQISSTIFPAVRIQRSLRFVFLSERVPLAITSGMRILTGYI